jgi:2-keto-4-pentenoate hydratase
MSTPDIDLRVLRGMERQLEARQARLDAGERPIGWKVGFGSQPAMERLDIAAPLVGFLTDRAVLDSGAEVSVASWIKPAIEPEIAIHVGKALERGDDRTAVQAAVEAIGPAIELADVDPPPADIQEILAGNIFNRHVILGKADVSRAGCAIDGLEARLYRDGAQVARITDLVGLTGDLIDIVGHVADLLHLVGAALLPGEVIIAGSIVPPIWAESSMEFRYELAPVDSISVRLSA